MSKVVIIECCNIENFPTGGQLSFVRQLINCYASNLFLG